MSVLINGTNGLIQAYDYQVLTTGFSYTFAAGTQTLVINPAGTLATGTITMPASPSDGMTITFSTTQQITALTLNGNTGQTVVNGASSMPAGSSATYIYRSANTSWFPMQAVPTATNTQIGVGQTYQNLTASRAFSTTYTNSTGKPIIIQPGINGGVGGDVVTVTVSGVALPTIRMYGISSAQYLIPAGATYSAACGSALNTWYELR